MRTVMAVTRNVTTRVPEKYQSHTSIRPSVLATMTMNVAETVEKPAAMIAASRAVYRPPVYMRLVSSRPRA